jgi:hypothetical protein
MEFLNRDVIAATWSWQSDRTRSHVRELRDAIPSEIATIEAAG